MGQTAPKVGSQTAPKQQRAGPLLASCPPGKRERLRWVEPMWLSVDLSAAWEKGRRAALAQGEWAGDGQEALGEPCTRLPWRSFRRSWGGWLCWVMCPQVPPAQDPTPPLCCPQPCISSPSSARIGPTLLSPTLSCWHLFHGHHSEALGHPPLSSVPSVEQFFLCLLPDFSTRLLHLPRFPQSLLH